MELKETIHIRVGIEPEVKGKTRKEIYMKKRMILTKIKLVVNLIDCFRSKVIK